MRIRYRLFTSILICFSFLTEAKSQDFIRDTVLVNFGDSTVHSIDFYCDSIIDLRKSGPNVLIVEQGKKYVIKYFDIYYTLPSSLSEEIESSFHWNSKRPTIQLEIERFEVRGYTKKRKDGNYLYSQIAISEETDTGFRYMGTLIHEISQKKPFPFPSDSLSSTIPIEAWKDLFAKNMNELSRDLKPGNLYTEKVRPQFMPRAMIHIGLKSIVVDGEFWFTNAEANKSFAATSYKLRYRNAQDFESLGFPFINNTSYYRLNDNFMLLSNYSGFIGINRWKESVDRKLGFQDVVHLNGSASQGIVFQPKFGRGLVAGIGITEDLVYIYEQKIMFEPAIFILLGLKL